MSRRTTHPMPEAEAAVAKILRAARSGYIKSWTAYFDYEQRIARTTVVHTDDAPNGGGIPDPIDPEITEVDP